MSVGVVKIWQKISPEGFPSFFKMLNEFLVIGCVAYVYVIVSSRLSIHIVVFKFSSIFMAIAIPLKSVPLFLNILKTGVSATAAVFILRCKYLCKGYKHYVVF
jgi:hypothetical protein